MSNWDTKITSHIEDIEKAEALMDREGNKKKVCDQKIREQKDVISISRGELKSMLEESGVVSEDHPRALLTMKESPTRIVQTKDFDIEKLPVDYREIIHKPNMTQIKAAMERGEEVPGFTYEKKPPTLQIKIKPKTRGKKK